MSSSRTVAMVVVLLLASSCTGGTSERSTSPAAARTVQAVTTSPTATAPHVPGCPHPPSPSHAYHKFLVEVRGSAQNGSLWALIFQTREEPVRADRQVKIVWRMTGTGNLSLVAVNGKGTQIAPDILGAHVGSNWDRPGDEWGSAFTFPGPGCWDIHAERTSVTGDVWLAVK